MTIMRRDRTAFVTRANRPQQAAQEAPSGDLSERATAGLLLGCDLQEVHADLIAVHPCQFAAAKARPVDDNSRKNSLRCRPSTRAI